MKIGSTYRADKVNRRDWETLGVEIGLESEWLFAEIIRQAGLLPAALTTLRRALAESGVGGSMPTRFVDGVAKWLPSALRNIAL